MSNILSVCKENLFLLYIRRLIHWITILFHATQFFIHQIINILIIILHHRRIFLLWSLVWWYSIFINTITKIVVNSITYLIPYIILQFNNILIFFFLFLTETFHKILKFTNSLHFNFLWNTHFLWFLYYFFNFFILRCFKIL